MTETTDLHRVLIQTFLARRFIKEKTLVELYKRAIAAVREDDPRFRGPYALNAPGVAEMAMDLSDMLHVASMEIAQARDQRTGDTSYILRNIDATEVAKLATDLNQQEVDFYRKLVEAIMISYPANSLANGQARSLVKDLEGTTKPPQSWAAKLLESLVSRGWISRSKRGRYSLSMRAIVELETYLKSEFPDYVHSCLRCKRLVFEGVACSKEECSAHYHAYCYAALNAMPNPKCQHAPCSASFRQYPPKPIGEQGVSTMEDSFSGGVKKRKRGRQTQGDDEAEEGEDEAEAESEEEEDSQTQDRKPGRDYVPGTQYEDDTQPSSSRRR
ncbi:hypothetical protein I350_05612 [Cryptococcus amylolentus CBS 6273]|uniref:Non-structural maintenance of chromosomes element 1 homolog n=1 Tax=Cryptococcus amylolentus CBS 6273 TaxID=1296118 RepID=A0A1E3JW30_9TREE|nr:hypothetical protein I350_05612 [Cryptococcus amylolentus CBS 6273]